jgi:NAD+ kinase
MKISIYGKTVNRGFLPHIGVLMKILRDQRVQVSIYKPFYDFINCESGIELKDYQTYSDFSDFDPASDLMVSIGGDGTFLESIPFIIRLGIPIVGINSGRLGFLANISKENIDDAFNSILSGRYEFEYRSLIAFKQPENIFNGLNYALNDITIQKSDSSMITIDAYINDEFLNTYWTDGLIISTPTGSTAYSLSVGGPIVVPGSGNLIIAPISSHNLTVRPLIIPDNNVISLNVKTRSGKYAITADNRIVQMSNKEIFRISKSDYQLKMIKLPNTSFYTTLRDKLKWGEDVRN